VAAHRTDRGAGPAVTVYSLGEEVAEAPFLAGLVSRIAGEAAAGEAGGEGRERFSYRDVAVLYRADAGGEVLAALARAFDEAGIPHVVPGRRGFYLRREVQDLRIVLRAVDAPADPCARYAALKTIFFGLSDDEILAWLRGGEGAASPRVRGALELLGRLSARRGRALLPDLVADLLASSGVEFAAARLPEGERIVRNLARAAELADEFARRGLGSAGAFAAELARRAREDREEGEAPAFDEGEDAVRVLTIHGAKGLEFPVVIVAALSRGGRKELEGLRADRARGIAGVFFPRLRTYSAWRRVPGAKEEVTF